MTKLKSPKPAKPYPDFPLFAHATRRWAKKIRGKFHYFGSWDNPDLALEKYLKEKDYLQAGRRPPANLDGETIRGLCNRYMTNKRHLFDTSEITDRTFTTYMKACEMLIKFFGKGRLVSDIDSSDFGELRAELSKTQNAVSLGNTIGLVRMVFKFAYDEGLIENPVRYGQSFNKPSRKTLRIKRNEKGKRMFEAKELRIILKASTQLNQSKQWSCWESIAGLVKPISRT